jgi:hypothetical protein
MLPPMMIENRWRHHGSEPLKDPIISDGAGQDHCPLEGCGILVAATQNAAHR